MGLEKVSGLIVYGFPLGEADQLISCFTSGGNQVKFVAKGSRKVKSKLAAAVQLFIFGEYVYYSSRGLPFLRQADILKSFAGVRRSLPKSGAAFAAVELCRLLIAEEARETEAFNLVMAYLLFLEDRDYDSLVFDSFRLKFAASLGYGMDFSRCANCGAPLKSGWLYWPAGGAVCSRCRGPAGIEVGPRGLGLLQEMGQRDFAGLQGLDPGLARPGAAFVDSLINWLTQGKTKAQAFRSVFEGR